VEDFAFGFFSIFVKHYVMSHVPAGNSKHERQSTNFFKPSAFEMRVISKAQKRTRLKKREDT
jgi:hypothetical protein